MKRPTIADIAREAGVSKGAVSYALNGRPGVSPATRERILAVAGRLNFHADSNARALAGAQARVVGLTLQRPPSTLGVEPFFMELISGLELELSRHSYALLLQMVAGRDEELAFYERWHSEARVDGVLVCDVRTGDPRVAALEALGLPAIVIGPPDASGSLPCVWSDDAQSMEEAVQYLAALGHRRVARVGGIAEFAHTAIRTAAFTGVCDRLGLADAVTVAADYSGESGARATRRLLSRDDRPTAIIYDNDIMAVAGLSVAHELGVAVPGQLSIVAWDDSPVCRLLHPPLTALTRDIGAYGVRAAHLLLAAIAGDPVASTRGEPAHLSPRGSTARLIP
ncbi:LacI family DNA-binding transcriptional regulator [Dactylosporangium vinaceum]|uniref:LacI family DNA-binding transcriptional regulator n=1 Tax=Dactylosporangium vinaceum TaxID=53362 RepID=A0ABV5M9T6_9ACTN|nr:LacI family DNA-binding transcriptional regulator [Dactylosporangium vinaceum]UAB93173.1 LacI family DNA-binding transcriptional regulator [Dactylosporangium vinaceum]